MEYTPMVSKQLDQEKELLNKCQGPESSCRTRLQSIGIKWIADARSWCVFAALVDGQQRNPSSKRNGNVHISVDGIKEACGSIHSVGYVCEESWHRPTGLLTVIEIRYVVVASSITTAVVKPKKTRNTEEIFRQKIHF